MTPVHFCIDQVHYTHKRPEGDKSGVRLKLTSAHVPFSAGMMMYASYFELPPGKPSHPVNNKCCYSGFEPAHGFAYRVHTHALGRYGHHGTSWHLGCMSVGPTWAKDDLAYLMSHFRPLAWDWTWWDCRDYRTGVGSAGSDGTVLALAVSRVVRVLLCISLSRNRLTKCTNVKWIKCTREGHIVQPQTWHARNAGSGCGYKGHCHGSCEMQIRYSLYLGCL
jgi:hypothetical protein